MAAPDDRVEFYNARGVLFGFMLICLGAAVVGGILVRDDPEVFGSTALAGWGIIAFSLLLALPSLMLKFKRRTPQVVIGRAGIFARGIGPKTIPWSDIERIVLRVHHSGRGGAQFDVGLTVHNEADYYAPEDLLRRVMDPLNVLTGYGRMRIPIGTLVAHRGEVAAAIDRFLPSNEDPERLRAWHKSKGNWGL